jgi:hypothetical protein
MRRVQLSNDFWAGLLFMAFGAVALFLSRGYMMGSASRMGPGYFPRALGLLLVVLGAALSVRAMRASEAESSTWRWRPLVTILGSLVVFCLLLKWLGLVIAGVLLVFVASTASAEFHWKEALSSGAIQAFVALGLFVWGLQIPLPVWPAFVAGP